MSSIRADSAIDHVLLGCSDLARGIAFVEERTGVRPAFGGVHPRRGTCNAVASLGEHGYLEIVAPDPQQREVLPWLTSTLPRIVTLHEPKVVGWAVHTPDIDALAERLRAAGIGVHEAHTGSRTRVDGRILIWKTATLEDDRGGILPFLIQWDTNSPHPSIDAPAGCRLERFAISSPNADELAQFFALIGVVVDVRHGRADRLEIGVSGPRGRFDAQNETGPL